MGTSLQATLSLPSRTTSLIAETASSPKPQSWVELQFATLMRKSSSSPMPISRRDRASFKYQVGLILSRPHTPTNFLLNLPIGSTFELPLLPDMSTSENPSAWAASEESTAAQRTVAQDLRTTLMRPAHASRYARSGPYRSDRH